MNSRKCRSCNAGIVFLKTEAGKLIPVNAETADPTDRIFDFQKHTSHYATCPDAASFR